MQVRPTVESVRAVIQTEIDYPRDMHLWDHDLMLDFIEASDYVAMPEIGDIICESKVLTAAEKKHLVSITNSRLEAAIGVGR